MSPDEDITVPGDVESILRAIETPPAALGGAAGRDRLLLDTLAAAYRDVTARLGEDTAQWAWGRLHHGRFTHAASPLWSEQERARGNVGPLPKSGGDSTPMMAAYRPADFSVSLGASVRMVVDVGAWDNSVCINAPGQSGDPRSPHYADLAPLWAKGEYVPMLSSREAVERAAESRLVWRPA